MENNGSRNNMYPGNPQYPQSQPTRVSQGNGGSPQWNGGNGYNNNGYNNGGYNYNNGGGNNNKGGGQNMIVILVLAVIAIVATGVAVYFIAKSSDSDKEVTINIKEDGDDVIEYDGEPVTTKGKSKTSESNQYAWLSEKKLTDADVAGVSDSDLRIYRNALYAKYGYKFKSPDLQKHFAQFSWYVPSEPNEGVALSKMTATEKANVLFLKNKEQGGGGSVSSAPAGGSMSYLTSRKINYNDIAGKSKSELRIMRNYIYAVHGYKFKSPDLQQYFGQFSWYTPRYADVNNQLNSIERYNIQFIQGYE